MKHDDLTGEIPADARLGRRSVYWPRIAGTSGSAPAGLPGRMETPIFDGHRLVPGNRLEGPAVLELETTTVVLHPRQTLQMDAYGNFELFPGAGRPAAVCTRRVEAP